MKNNTPTFIVSLTPPNKVQISILIIRCQISTIQHNFRSFFFVFFLLNSEIKLIQHLATNCLGLSGTWLAMRWEIDQLLETLQTQKLAVFKIWTFQSEHYGARDYSANSKKLKVTKFTDVLTATSYYWRILGATDCSHGTHNYGM